MTITNQYTTNNPADRLQLIQQTNRRCLRKLQAIKASGSSTIVVTALPAFVANRQER